VCAQRADVLRLCRRWLRSLLVMGSVALEETALTDEAETPLPPTLSAAAGEGAVGHKRQRSETIKEEEDGRGGADGVVGANAGSGVGVAGAEGDDATCVAYVAETRAPLAPGMAIVATAPDDVVELARCVVLSKSVSAAEAAPSGHDATLLLFTLTHEVGSLAHALDALNRHRVNLLSIRSYVDLQDARRVDFMVTAEGHEQDEALSGAIRELRQQAAAVQVFGSYRRAE
jgi:hypothetical protein